MIIADIETGKVAGTDTRGAIMSENLFKGKRILVTGGTGSIGSEIVRQLLRREPEVVRILSRSEHAQFEMERELAAFKSHVRFFLGDVRERDRLMRALKDIDIVFHAAALKHVPLCEYNPFEAVKTNVVGTQNVIDAVMESSAERAILISTDKAVNPMNTMGASKLLAERLFSTANFYKGRRDVVFATVRFGNVLGTRGSVIPTMLSQIRAGGPVTVTHPDMTRFYMTLPQAVTLVLRAAEMAAGASTFVLKMPVFRISDLVEILIEFEAPRSGRNPKDINVDMIGRRPGERLFEELMTSDESHYMTERDDMFVIQSALSMKATETEFAYRSNTQEPVSKEELRNLLFDQKIIG